MLRIDGVDICLAKVEGRKNCFSSVPFRLTKSRWVADYDVQSCRLCDSKFNQLRRKHHCRQCGDVFCNKCCKDKIILPQYNLMESERVCDSCKPIAVLVAQSISSQPSEQHIAALEINDMLQTSDGIRKAIQFGGMQAIVQLAMIDNIEIRKCLLSAIHTLATYPPLHEYMAITGAIKAVMRNAVCLLANLACSQQDQACLIDYLAILTDLILDYGQCEDVEYQIARCIANTTRYENAAKALVKDLEKIIKYHLKSENEKISCQAERALCNLLSYCPDETIDYLARNGAAEFLKVIAKTPEILKSISSHLKMYARELDT
ncbi:uncharacterized protein TRIADDRAFT_61912 [Trichoplax adhaerens]|uniref:FYVE-type domain-containing protein n=1 Tax=Trichoplax adhaerens TaxID=10228 RepID=B3SCB5_TRIAD|nr:hypothetical protein TRIADDRAFT_61912 [Trichoplax adhaerens]EDV19649.1 hypothetical protein TRIADDRAFT_61912 [Trichoplax adhaerens]|eukprot:XP_002117887.1 hypothetical protein TRIADDRAFT_61912 [Trichoplax adhaerens]